MLTLLYLASSAQAGHYTVTYSGGSVSYGDITRPYALGSDGYYGDGGGAGWGFQILPDGTRTATSGSLQCSGEITATFTWQPSGTDDSPPDKVMIEEKSTTGVTGVAMPGAAPSQSTLDNGLDFPVVPPTPVPPYVPIIPFGGVSQGTRYKIKADPGTSFTVTCSPSISVSGTGSVNPPANAGVAGDVRYKATALPLEVVLSGGIGPQTDKRFLIGQQVSATVATGGLQATSFDWSVSDGEPFKDYSVYYSPNATASHTTFETLGAENGSQLAFYFRKALFSGAQSTVSCDVHLAVPVGAQPSEGFDVTLERDCLVDKPSNTLAVQTGTTQGFPSPANPQAMRFYGGTYQGHVSGVLWAGTVTTPVIYGSGGGWNYTQLVTTGRVRDNAGITQSWSINGRSMLDTTFGYEPVSPALYPDNGSEQVEGDAPAQGFIPNSSYLRVRDSFITYTLYKPPGAGSCFVPLKNLEWYWQGKAQPDSSGVWQISDTDGSWSFLDDFPPHPMWTERADASTAVWVP